jgi:hypothetical protein
MWCCHFWHKTLSPIRADVPEESCCSRFAFSAKSSLRELTYRIQKNPFCCALWHSTVRLTSFLTSPRSLIVITAASLAFFFEMDVTSTLAALTPELLNALDDWGITPTITKMMGESSILKALSIIKDTELVNQFLGTLKHYFNHAIWLTSVVGGVDILRNWVSTEQEIAIIKTHVRRIRSLSSPRLPPSDLEKHPILYRILLTFTKLGENGEAHWNLPFLNAAVPLIFKTMEDALGGFPLPKEKLHARSLATDLKDPRLSTKASAMTNACDAIWQMIFESLSSSVFSHLKLQNVKISYVGNSTVPVFEAPAGFFSASPALTASFFISPTAIAAYLLFAWALQGHIPVPKIASTFHKEAARLIQMRENLKRENQRKGQAHDDSIEGARGVPEYNGL